MIDPFPALGLASAVLQFIDFGSTVYGEYKRLRNGGGNTSPRAAALPKSFEAALNDLTHINRVLKSTPRLHNASETEHLLIQHEDAINSLLDEATDMAEDFLNLLVFQCDGPNRPSSRWNTTAEAINSVRTEGELDQFKEKLDGSRRDLGVHVLALVNAKVVDRYGGMQHHYDYDLAHGQREEIVQLRQDFHRVNENVVKIVAFNQSGVRSGSSSSSTPIFDQHARVAAEAKQGPSTGIVAAMITLASGETRYIHPSGSSKPIGNGLGINGNGNQYQQNGHFNKGSGSGSSVQDAKFDTVLRLSSDPGLMGQPAAAELEYVPPKDFAIINKAVLDMLHFRQITDRFESVKMPYESTFSWVFANPKDPSTFDNICRPWSNLSAFLESKDQNDKCYWIKGKAGSGKSTLMKYIVSDRRLRQHLQRWAGPSDDLIYANFFSWHLGADDQRLVSGLFRSLLYRVLCARPDLIPTIMPEMCLEAARSRTGQLETPSAAELRMWFERLLHATATNVGNFKLFIAIDGIDEFQGDPEELIYLIRNTKGDRVKYLVSSRPMQSCAKAFGSYPSLKLQDLTEDDIRRYTEAVLGEQLHVRDRGGEDWFRLVNEIVKRSEGVFLWVTLVIRSLLMQKGLQNHDNLKEMRKRLDQLPSGDVEKLYGHMLKKIPPDYKKNAAKLFRIVMASMDIEQQIREQPILAIQLSLAEGVWDEVKLIPEGSLTWDLEEVRVRDIEAKVSSRCLGLLEVHTRKDDLTHKPYIDFTHRTAVDFLRDSQIAIDLLYGTLSSDFNPQAYLVRSCLTVARVMPTTTRFDGDVVWDSMRTCLEYARIAEYKKRPVFDGYLDRLDQAMSRHWFAALASSTPYNSSTDIHRLHHWSQKASWFWTGPKDVDMARVQAEFNQFCYPSLYVNNGLTSSTSTSLDEENQRLLREIDLGFLVVAIMYSLPTYLRTCLHRLKEAEEEIEASMKRKSTRKALINKIDKIKGGKQTYVPPKVAHTATRLLFLWAQLTAASSNFCIVPWTKPHARVCRTLLEFGANPMCEFSLSVSGKMSAHRNAWELTCQAILVLVHPALRKKLPNPTELLPNQKVRAVLWITNFFVKNGADRGSKVPSVVLHGAGMKNLVLECPGRAKDEEATLLEWLEPYAKGPATNEGWRRRKSRRPNGEGGDEFDEDSDDYGSEDDDDYDDDSDDDGRSVIMPASRGDRGEQIILRKPLRRAGSGDTLLMMDDVDKPLPPIPRESETSMLSTQAGMPEIFDEDYNMAKTPVMHHQALPDTPPPSAPDEIFFLPTASFVELPNSTPPSPTETISPILPQLEAEPMAPTPPPRPHEPTPEMQHTPRFPDFSPRMPLSPLSQRFPLSPLSQRFPLSPVSPRMPLSPLSPRTPGYGGHMVAPSPADFLFPAAFRAVAHHRRQTEAFPGLGINPSQATLVDPNSDDVEDLYPDIAARLPPLCPAAHQPKPSPVHPLELAMQRGQLSGEDSDQETVRGRRGRDRSNTMTTATTSTTSTTNTTSTTSTTTGNRHREAREMKRREEKEDKERREREASRAARKLPEPKAGKQGYAKYLGQTGAKAAAVVPQKLFNLAFWVGDWCKRAYGRCSWVVKIRW
ncbi:unnamed protein product [Sordaria macrospora k-hell]|uniref:WGS project CABT00000000 data, contig 2.66 n=1 Tax=Sordaria macrospora (strain ATCC MYA-333 / DSM 997 / K(L3346) / K-hell) TaxID=771870 RepID=F7WAX3_SORMK|nr:uncharacterized protein SMAC_08827 [Sordaria macrospora k-hell]CCC14288.1 unnamed protein product [Sordaria macrospora k-hell]